MKTLDRDLFAAECTFKTSRSGGKGGQNVNKVETKVELSFDVVGTSLFTEDEKAVILQKLSTSIRDERYYYTVCEKERSQYKNKELVINKAIRILCKAIEPVKPRKATKPTKLSKEIRLKGKQINALKKINRRRISDDF